MSSTQDNKIQVKWFTLSSLLSSPEDIQNINMLELIFLGKYSEETGNL